MKKALVVLAVATVAAASSAAAGVNVNVGIGIPAPRVVVSAPSIRFEVAPRFIAPPRLGFYVGVDTPYDILFSDDYYYLYYSNSWHRSSDYNGPWVELPYRHVPAGIRNHRIEQIRSYRDREYRTYRSNPNHYRGRQFRPDYERRGEFKDERRRDREEWKEDKRRDREEWKDDKRHDKEERREEKQERKQRGHGRE